MSAPNGAAVVLTTAALLALPAVATWTSGVYPESPPAAHTGGFGEPTCHVCHFDYEPDPPDGMLTIEDLPERFEPGQKYRLTALLTRSAMRSGGFELAARFADGERAGTQAGTLEPVDDRTEVTRAGSPAVEYLHHTRTGTALSAADTLRWSFLWTAPSSGTVIFHIAGNASNDDASPFADHIYSRALPVVGASGDFLTLIP